MVSFNSLRTKILFVTCLSGVLGAGAMAWIQADQLKKQINTCDQILDFHEDAIDYYTAHGSWEKAVNTEHFGQFIQRKKQKNGNLQKRGIRELAKSSQVSPNQLSPKDKKKLQLFANCSDRDLSSTQVQESWLGQLVRLIIGSKKDILPSQPGAVRGQGMMGGFPPGQTGQPGMPPFTRGSQATQPAVQVGGQLGGNGQPPGGSQGIGGAPPEGNSDPPSGVPPGMPPGIGGSHPGGSIGQEPGRQTNGSMLPGAEPSRGGSTQQPSVSQPGRGPDGETPSNVAIDENGKYVIPVEKARDGRNVPLFWLTRHFSQTIFPMEVDGKLIGYALDETTEEGLTDIAANIVHYLLVMAIFIPAMGYFAWRVAKKLAEPLERLTAAVKAMKEGKSLASIKRELKNPNEKLSQQATDPKDEIGILTQQFAEMADIEYRLKKKLEQALKEAEEAKELADKANKAKSEFLSNMSHELRTPLNAVIGFSQLMQRDAGLSEEQKDNLATIRTSGQHLLQLINNVLSMSKIESGKTELDLQPFEVRLLLKDLVTLFEFAATQKGLRLNVDIAPEVPKYINGDEGKLRQVLINLLGNAMKFTAQGGISLQAGYRSPNRLLLEVADTGPGIALEEQHKLFKAFEQTATGRQSTAGTGLGLALSKNFVELMGGKIDVKSEEGEGTSFFFEINAEASEAAPDHSDHREVIGLAPGSPVPRLLVVDDRFENRNLLSRLLAMTGFEVREAADGQEAIDLWKTWQPNLIWMDLRMPKVDGYKAAHDIKEDAEKRHKKVFIIALTASVFEEEKQDDKIQKWFDGFARKPFKEQTIFDIIAQHLSVKYLYANPVNGLGSDLSGEFSSDRATQGKAPLTHQDLAPLPHQWRAALAAAAREADFFKLEALINKLAPRQAALATRLNHLLSRYDYDRLHALAQANGAAPDTASQRR